VSALVASASLWAALVAAALTAVAPRLSGEPTASGPCVGAPWRIVIAGPEEPGERLRVRGRVRRPDGTTPAPGVTVYAYQTDATGVYAREAGAPPRLRGFMTTDAEGRYEYLTIRPGAYPGRMAAAHIHHQLWGGGWPAQWNEEILFDDDPLVSARERERSRSLGRFGAVRTTRRGTDGVLEVEHELRLKSKGDDFEEEILHGLRACGLAPER